MHRTSACLALPVAACALAATNVQAASSAAIVSLGAPAGFDELSRPHKMLVDVYFGGRKVGEAMVISAPGTLRFLDSAKVLGLIPEVEASSGLAAALAGDLPSHADLVCSPGNAGHCGELSPATAGVIFDEGRLRVDLYVAPGLVRIARPVTDPYLRPSNGPLSLTSSVGLAISGTSSGSPSYNVQNRTIVSLGGARLRSDSSYASKLGLIVDDLVAEVDRHDLRYSAGLFWAPGIDLTGQRRIAGVGVGTQFDTRADRDLLEGTPLVVFLQQPSRVELIVDGRLIASDAYAAGNIVLDTSTLPDGSYPVLLRIRQDNGTVHDEQRFFIKNAHVAPVGEPLVFAYAGMLANTRRNRPISLSDTFYYQLGAARRLSRSVAVDLSAAGAGRKKMLEAGAWVMTRFGRARVAGLVATSGDKGALLQLGSNGRGPFNFNLDLRRVWSSDGRPLIPLPAHVDNFGSTAPTGAQLGNGSYTQISGSIGYTLGRAYFSLVGSLRHDEGFPTDYTVGPGLNLPILSRGGVELVFQADAQRTRTTTALFSGLRVQFTSNRLSVLGTAGRAARRTQAGGDSDADRMVGSISAGYFHESADRTQVSANAGLNRSLDSSDVHAGGTIYSRLGSARGDILHPLQGRGGLQYGLTLQSGTAINRHEIALGGRDMGESALIVSVGGESGRSAFDVLVDEQPRARLLAGASTPIFLQPYRSYKVRIRSVGATSLDYDSGARSVTLYPGNVANLEWSTRPLVTVFGQAIGADGLPVAGAMVQSQRGIGETDEHGYFQIDVAGADTLSFTRGTLPPCHAMVAAESRDTDLVSLGKVVCR
jgi:hypothetical protein